MKIKNSMWATISAGILLALSSIAFAQDEEPARTLFTNVNVLDDVISLNEYRCID